MSGTSISRRAWGGAAVAALVVAVGWATSAAVLGEQAADDAAELKLDEIIVFRPGHDYAILNVTPDGSVVAAHWWVTHTISERYPFCLVAGFNDEGLAPAVVPDRFDGEGEGDSRGYGVVDRNGDWVVPADYNHYLPGDDGFGTIKRDDEHALMSPTGEIVVEFGRYDRVGVYRDGLCSFVAEDGRRGFVDGNGEVVIPPTFETEGAPQFTEGICVLPSTEIDGPATYIDREGNVLFQIEARRAESFHEGRALICVWREWEELPPLDPRFDDLPDDIKEDMRQDPIPKQRYGFVDREGDMVIDAQWGGARSFSEGRAPVCRIDEWNEDEMRLNDDAANLLWGYIDRSGEVVIDYRFDYAGPFSHGLAPVRIGENAGYIDREGNMVIQFRFNQTKPFFGDMAFAELDGDLLVINREGKVLFRQNHEELLYSHGPKSP